jgi:uncharacterized Zn finger protein (UPF0148 family)
MEQKNLSCSLCHSYLFEEDDVVYCPVCGAPHHRECYNSIGHCALEATHGTDQQYDKIRFRAQQEDQKREEANTQNENSEHNAYEFKSPFGATIHFDPLGGVPGEQIIDEDVTAKEAAKFVFSNTTRYIPKFAKGNKVSWNFMALLFPCGWFLSRKMYKNGIIAGLLKIIATLLSLPLVKVMYNLGVNDAASYYDMAQRLMEALPSINTAIFFASFIGAWINIAVSLVSALFGDYLYKKHTVSSIQKIKAESENIELDFLKKGGVSMVLFFVGVFAVEYIPSIIANFIQ